jgi:hypothetical protein
MAHGLRVCESSLILNKFVYLLVSRDMQCVGCGEMGCEQRRRSPEAEKRPSPTPKHGGSCGSLIRSFSPQVQCNWNYSVLKETGSTFRCRSLNGLLDIHLVNLRPSETCHERTSADVGRFFRPCD